MIWLCFLEAVRQETEFGSFVVGKTGLGHFQCRGCYSNLARMLQRHESLPQGHRETDSTWFWLMFSGGKDCSSPLAVKGYPEVPNRVPEVKGT